MARPEAALRAGFFAAPEDAVSKIAQMLEAPASEDRSFAIIDPCAGEGEAIWKLSQILNPYIEDVYAIELDKSRAEVLKRRLPDSKVIAPADFFGVTCPSKSFSFAWVNPPFDSEIGGGSRVEGQFLDRATKLLKPGGIIAFVCPEASVDNFKIEETLRTWYDDVSVVRFPDHCRDHNEVVVLGVKRDEMISYWHRTAAETIVYDERQPVGSDARGEEHVYCVPCSQGPGRKLRKISMTDKELLDALEKSPIVHHLEPKQTDRLITRPPLELGKGHLALLLGSGHLDGVVDNGKEPPHVVRGTVRKVEYVKDSEDSVDSAGNVNNKTVIGQRITLVIRAVGQDGVIHTYTPNGQELTEPERPKLDRKRQRRRKGKQVPGRRRRRVTL